MTKNICTVTCVLLSALPAFSATYYVSPSGDDTQSGSAAAPFKTLDKALLALRGVTGESREIILTDGVHAFSQAQEITAADSGTSSYPLVIRAENEGQAVLSAGVSLTGLSWTSHSGGIVKATIPVGLDLNAIAGDGLWVSGTQAHLARYPNYDANAKYYNGTASDALSSDRVSTWADPSGGFIHALHHAEWGGNHWHITGKSNNTTVTYEGGWMNNRGGDIHPDYRMVENIFEELDAENEWFLDKDTRTLYFYPPAGVDPATSEFVLASQEEIIRLVGTDSTTPVKHVQISGLQFSHTARTFMQTDEPLLRSDWRIHRGGAIYLRFAEDSQIQNCVMTQLGGNGVFLDGYNRRITCSGFHMYELGAGAFNAVGRTDAVWNPMYDPYGTPLAWNSINKTDKGPKTNDYPAEIVFTDSLIHDIGTVEKQVAGVQISVAHKVTASKLSIYRVPRAGINISEGAFGGHLIDRCDVFDTVQETGDHGSFNSWGRDRYWSTDYTTINSRIAADPTVPSELPLLDMLDPITIQNSRWRCDHGWDIDLDDGSSWYIIKNNVCLGGGIKLREGFYRTVENNITVANTFHPHIWFEQSLDVVRNNIWGTQYEDIWMDYWGQEIDHNFFYTSSSLSYAQGKGLDANSIFGDPLYQSAETLDYTVNEQSVLDQGFVNFPMNEFGVEKPTLKALAEVPVAPDTTIPPDPIHQSHPVLGATVKSVSTLGEVSATGLPEMNGTLFLEVPANSDIARMGLQTMDVIREIDGVRTDTLEEFVFAWARATVTSGTVTAKLWRTQAEQTITLPEFPGMRMPAATAEIKGTSPYPVYDSGKDYIGSWTNVDAYLEWSGLNVDQPDSFLVLVEQAIPSSDVSTYQIEGLSSTPLAVNTTETGGWETFSKVIVGKLPLSDVGTNSFILRPQSLSSAGGVMNLREALVIPSANSIDTDGDGVIDALEVTKGTDLNSAASTPGSHYTGLIGWWTLDETTGDEAADVSGKIHTGTVNGTISVTGADGSARNFNGSSDSVTLGNSVGLDIVGEITMAAWVKPEATNDFRNIFAHGYSTSPNGEVVLRIYNGQYQIASWNGTNVQAAGGDANVDLNTWVHIAGVYDGANWRLYRNGVEIASVASAQGSVSVNEGWAIGSHGNGSERFFDGGIDDVRLYSRGLTAAEMANMYGEYSGNQAPLANDAVFAVAEDAALGFAVGTVTASDPDTGDILSYAITAGNTGGAFAIDANTGEITTAENLDYEATSSYLLTVTVTDSGSLTDTAAITVNVSDVNEAPSLANSNGPDAEEDQPYSASLAGSGTDPDAGDSLSYSKLAGPTWLSIASNGTLSGTPSSGDVGTNQWTVRVTDAGGLFADATLNITVNAASGENVTYNATAESTTLGTVSGGLASTVTSDNGYETITEEQSGGQPSKKRSELEHEWTFNVTGGMAATLRVEAYHTANSEGDDFTFSYSTDGSTYTDVLTVTKTADDNIEQTAALPSSLSGAVYIRVVDNDRTQGNSVVDSLYVDLLAIDVTPVSGPPSEAANPSPVNVATGTSLNPTLTWDASGGADSYDVYFGTTSPGSLQGNQAGTSFTPGTLLASTTYFWRVDAVNGNGTTTGTVWSFTTGAGGGSSTLFSDDFEDGNVNGWTITGTVDANTTAANTGVYGAKLRAVASMTVSVDTTGVSSVDLEYDRITVGYDAGEVLTVEWSADGSNWTTVESTSDANWGTTSVTLPAGAAGQPALQIRISTNANRNNENGYVDNFTVTGN